jgi:hypothetical protein
MKKTVQLGAPSLNGKDANELVTAAFADCRFPLQVVVTNLVAHALTFPEISGLYVAPCTDSEKCSVTVEIRDMDAFQRLASSIEQIAELNSHENMLEIKAVEVTETFPDDAEEVISDQAVEVTEKTEVVTEAPAVIEKQNAGKPKRKG